MKKFFVMSLMLCLSLAAMADGEKTKVDGSQLSKITFRGDYVVLHFTDGSSQTIDDMSTVYVYMSTATGMEERVAITTKAGLEGQPVYNLKGQLLGTSAASLEKGVYIIGGKKVIIK